MPLILRVDVDKPYGNSNLINAVRSKLSEDYWYPDISVFNSNYLGQLAEFLKHCNRENVSGHFYFRHCTVPDQRIADLMNQGKHKAGIHAENTRSLETFKTEWESVAAKCEIELISFSKHGSGQLKLGKYHYAPYEPENYKEWAKELNVDFRFGNDICISTQDFMGEQDFYSKIFWIERDYRNEQFSDLESVVNCAKQNVVPILIHPSNYDSTPEVKEDFSKLISLAKENNVDWIL
ncbi:MAG: hypothetical protein QNK23_04770 [Crocinitomicaceae bacterium]|nr:hypothetical protein [Crocinitomicaceae bacterium]